MWLLNKAPEPDILGARLPSREQVFIFFMYQHHVFKKTVPDSVSATSEKLKAIWGKAKLTTKTDANIRKNVKNQFEEYQTLKKDRNRITDGAELKRKIWKGDLEDLFDISSADVLERRDILDEDKSFFISQREDRSNSSMAGVDVAEVAKEKKKKEAAKKLENRKRKQEAETERLLEKVPYPRSGLSSSSTTSSEDEDGDFKAPATKLSRRAPTNKLSLNIELTSAWDREGLSVRQASSAYIATAKDLGHDVSQLVISPSTVHRSRTRNNETLAIQLEREAFNDPPPFVLHWDGNYYRKQLRNGLQRTALPWLRPGRTSRRSWESPSHMMQRDKKLQGRFSRRSSESVPGSRSLAFPSIRRPRTAACSQAPVYTWKISSVAPCSGWHAGTTY
ncbi:hypothetical protein GWK47_040439 [Chionoecetes opilio]|uniref:Uncharacterized protein n=1 Tax=Chionoecetes opilio TaxID=41210 RepID=A0A8J5CL71_CHIOP|nr:hypothetical protein GWK47_040439 [Chionoecetes opilio]